MIMVICTGGEEYKAGGGSSELSIKDQNRAKLLNVILLQYHLFFLHELYLVHLPL
jgi:hypothetical protein